MKTMKQAFREVALEIVNAGISGIREYDVQLLQRVIDGQHETEYLSVEFRTSSIGINLYVQARWAQNTRRVNDSGDEICDVKLEFTVNFSTSGSKDGAEAFIDGSRIAAIGKLAMHLERLFNEPVEMLVASKAEVEARKKRTEEARIHTTLVALVKAQKGMRVNSKRDTVVNIDNWPFLPEGFHQVGGNGKTFEVRVTGLNANITRTA